MNAIYNSLRVIAESNRFFCQVLQDLNENPWEVSKSLGQFYWILQLG